MRIQKELNIDGYDLNSVLGGNPLGGSRDALEEFRSELKHRAEMGDEEARGVELFMFGPWEDGDEPTT